MILENGGFVPLLIRVLTTAREVRLPLPINGLR